MGFWDKLGEVVQTVGEYANSKNEEIERYKEEYERYSDEQLIRRFKNIPRVTEPEKSRVCKFCVNVELEIPKNNRRKNHGAY